MQFVARAKLLNTCIRFLVYAIIFCIPLYVVRFELLSIPTNALELLVLALLVGFFTSYDLRVIGEKLRSLDRLFVWGTVLLFLGLVFGAFVSQDFFKSLGALKGWFLVPLVFAFIASCVLDNPQKRERALFALALSGFCVALIALAYALLGNFTFDYRLSAFYESPNMLAMYVSPALLIVMQGLKLKVRGQKPKLHVKSQNYFSKSYAIFFCFVVLALTLFLTRSVGAIASVVLLVGFYLLITLGKTHRIVSEQAVQKVAKVLLLLVFIALLLAPSLSLFINPWELAPSSFASRFMIWKSSLFMLKEHGVFGIGPGVFQDVHLSHQRYFPPYLEWASPHPHNIVLATWLYGGVAGLMGFFFILFWFFKKARELLSGSRAFVVCCTLLVVSYLLIHGIFDNTLWRNDVAMIFWMSIFMGTIYQGSKNSAMDVRFG